MISVFSCEFEFKSHWSSARVYSGSNELKIAFNLNFKTRGEGGMGGRGREGGSSAGPMEPGPSCSRSGCTRAGCGAETQGTTQRQEHCWTTAQPEFKNKRFAVRIKANSAFMYITSYMVRRKRFFWLLEEGEALPLCSRKGGLARGRGCQALPLENPQ